METQAVLQAHPESANVSERARLVDALVTCYQACTACVSEEMLDKPRAVHPVGP